MFNLKVRYLNILTATAALTLFFCQSVLASTAIDSIGTGSSGNYSHGAQKSEGSKNKKTGTHHIYGEKGHHKSEGNGSKSYSHPGKSKRHSYKKSEGSTSKRHAQSTHGYKKDHKSCGGHGGRTNKCPFTHLLRFKDKLSLTKTQVAEIKRLRFEHKKKSILNKAEHKIARMEFDELVHTEKVDAQAIRSAAEKIAKFKTQMIMAKAEAKIALLNLLTEEQRKKTHAMHSAH